MPMIKFVQTDGFMGLINRKNEKIKREKPKKGLVTMIFVGLSLNRISWMRRHTTLDHSMYSRYVLYVQMG